MVTEKWYSRIDIERDETLVLPCPACGADYLANDDFDHDPRQCHKCKTKLIEWNLIVSIFLIHPEKAPQPIKDLIQYLSSKTEPDAFEELKILMKFFGNWVEE